MQALYINQEKQSMRKRSSTSINTWFTNSLSLLLYYVLMQIKTIYIILSWMISHVYFCDNYMIIINTSTIIINTNYKYKYYLAIQFLIHKLYTETDNLFLQIDLFMLDENLRSVFKKISNLWSAKIHFKTSLVMQVLHDTVRRK